MFAQNRVESEIKLQRQPEAGRSWLQQRQLPHLRFTSTNKGDYLIPTDLIEKHGDSASC